MNARTSSRPRRGACSEYCRSMSGAASSSTIFGFQGLPQNSLSQRPTISLLFAVDMTLLLCVVPTPGQIGASQPCNDPISGMEGRSVLRHSRGASAHRTKQARELSCVGDGEQPCDLAIGHLQQQTQQWCTG